MIDKQSIEQFIEKRLEGTDYFLVGVHVTPSNEITIDIDSFDSVDIDFCIELSRAFEEEFPREPEDYQIEVGSAGLTSPFRVLKQFEKNIGNKVEVLAKDGKKYIGELLKADPETFTILTTVKEKPEGAKRPVERETEMTFSLKDVNSVKYHFEF